ncbi:Endolytic peptidoglycan transglycosylase RlpA [Vibrio stylophorae]|uniref:Endolytic peptidoglycan transglycosylase RlpA n=1 Tax=Vibrio stylophorae TaxID=659351 RepID=A0ABM8ZV14_9VIBR|nr:septal ring lytic transglycosylase RlpA family protein [Vibrio stylophorae]CAH0534039.1 Endolytic peptidoglycan transglycosylase RlpA [Vibrio stylophorae]
MRRFLFIFTALLLAGCAKEAPKTDGRYELANDVAPAQLPSHIHQESAVPRYEPPSLAGNKDYTVRGVRYQVLKSPTAFSQTGDASWYGEKFHGHKTSNGEVYDMYSMTAAHKTLPLPSYVRVTNLNNQKSVIVRVNDRGPFHQGRIIDLSYAAALKLDVIRTGTAPVQIELIPMTPPNDKAEWQSSSTHNYWIQLVALSNAEKAKEKAMELSKQFETPIKVRSEGQVHRLRAGPFTNRHDALMWQQKLQAKGFDQAYILTEAH